VEIVPIEIEDEPTPEVEYSPRPHSHGLCLEVVNGWYSKLKQGKATQSEIQRWKSRAGSRATIKKTTFVRDGVREPAVAVYLENHGNQFGWIARAHIPAVNRETHGYLASKGQYTLEFVCDQAK
jgi:hypothetical protein